MATTKYDPGDTVWFEHISRPDSGVIRSVEVFNNYAGRDVCIRYHIEGLTKYEDELWDTEYACAMVLIDKETKRYVHEMNSLLKHATDDGKVIHLGFTLTETER